MAESISEVLRELGDNDAADFIDSHKECHDTIAQQAGRIAELEAQLHKLNGEHCGLKNVYQEEKTSREYFEAQVADQQKAIEEWKSDYKDKLKDITDLEAQLKEMRGLITSALPHIECNNCEQDALITVIGNMLEQVKEID